ncbi:Bax inhibitor-1/YccA family protein [Nocardioides acrostichi]|uniref:Bax inhibitor-1/YccA family protein n=1 Tax=Nocardioides acrostichi TaxID=2784339 RepID=A0A930UZF7_9ACTN|nr:Bax inhibitor-1/YccA family protein [Nocardioides acrostichi]MBF4162896.1 Bax inhibitor-1/YccA family protein [Nocardioides acrostichi]
MQSNNPVFRRSEEFNRPGMNAYGNQTYAGNGATHSGYGTDPSTWGTGAPGEVYSAKPDQGGVMTIDSVVQKTAMSLGVVFVAAFATWFLTPDLRDFGASLGPLYAALMIGGFGAFALSMVNSFKRVVSPALVLAFCALEGVSLGAFSKIIEALYVQPGQGSIVVQAVIGTFAAFAGTLAAYKFLNIRVGDKFRTFVMAAMFGMVALGLLEMVLSVFGSALGVFGFGTIGLVFAIAGLALGVFMLILDFDFVEQGIANGLPERESWRAAFALTVSLVWIYTNLLRILAILRGD